MSKNRGRHTDQFATRQENEEAQENEEPAKKITNGIAKRRDRRGG